MAAASAMTSATIGAALAMPTAGSRHGGSLCIVYVSEACNSPRLHSLFSCLGLNLEIHEEQNKAVPDHIAQSLFPLQYSPSKSHAMSTLQDNKRQVYNSGLVHSFVDFQYNRSSFYFLGERATQQALTLCNAAFEM